MNRVELLGRLTKNPELRYISDLAIARYTLAVPRKFKKDGEEATDFINIVTFGKSAEFVEKYFYQGLKVAISGRIQTGSYVNKDGIKVYTTDVVAEEQEFAESKKTGEEVTETLNDELPFR